MKYSKQEVMQYVQEEDVKFIRLAFCDVFGRQKNISIMPQELPRAFEYGIAFDASSVAGFGDETHSDLLLHPEAETLMLLPWRPEHGKVVRMFSGITYPDGRPFECDTRNLLKNAVARATEAGYCFSFGAEQEFYLFQLDEKGKPTHIPYDEAGYMDIAPDDRGENIRREICLTLEQMGIRPESSHHEEGPGQNEIDFRYSDALTAADHALTFRTVAKTVAHRNGLAADFGPKPLPGQPGNGFHINVSVNTTTNVGLAASANNAAFMVHAHNANLTASPDNAAFMVPSHNTGLTVPPNNRNLPENDMLYPMIAGILEKAGEMTVFLNPVQDSYLRFGSHRAPKYISWSNENRSQLIRIPAAEGEYRRAELRSPDPAANPYVAFALIIYAGLYGITNRLPLRPAADFNLFRADEAILAQFSQLPGDLQAARRQALESAFIREHIPAAILDIYCGTGSSATTQCRNED